MKYVTKNIILDILIGIFLVPIIAVSVFFISFLVKGQSINEATSALAERIVSMINKTRSFSEEESGKVFNDQNVILPQQVNNVGYTFYLGQIDYPDAAEIGDGLKKGITNIIHAANFPKRLLNNLAIVTVNTLAANSNQYIKMPPDKFLKVNEFSPDFVKGGSIFSQRTKEYSIIFINKDIISNTLNRLKLVLTHELGHQIGIQLTAKDWEEYYRLRKIPKGTSKYGQSWQLSPSEDFAEVYKYIYTDDPIKTVYGLLVLKNGFWAEEGICKEIYEKLVDDYTKDETEQQRKDFWKFDFTFSDHYAEHQNDEIIISNIELQNCRRDVLLHPQKYPKAYEFVTLVGLPYESTVSQETRDFFNKIIKRFN